MDVKTTKRQRVAERRLTLGSAFVDLCREVPVRCTSGVCGRLCLSKEHRRRAVGAPCWGCLYRQLKQAVNISATPLGSMRHAACRFSYLRLFLGCFLLPLPSYPFPLCGSSQKNAKAQGIALGFSLYCALCALVYQLFWKCTVIVRQPSVLRRRLRRCRGRVLQLRSWRWLPRGLR